MKTVYSISKGEYSDYRILGIFKEKKHAEEFMKKYDKLDEVRIEEFNLYEHLVDAENDLKPRKFLQIRMDKDGNSRIYKYDAVAPDTDKETEYFIQNFPEHKIELAVVRSYDEDRIVKVANEIRAYLLATNRWPVLKKNGSYDRHVEARVYDHPDYITKGWVTKR